MSKPLISIITPINKVYPWFNLRLINVCSQDYDNWEWLILDNSQDRCVQKYIDEFFTCMQGVHYSHCREKIRCIFEPMPMVKIEDGRIGIIKNWLIELSNCGDDGYIFTLDGDDFIFDGFLRRIAEIHEAYPECESISGYCEQGLAQYLSNGNFVKHDLPVQWCDYVYLDYIDFLNSKGFSKNNGWDIAAHEYINKKRHNNRILDYKCSLKIPNTSFVFEFDTITGINENGYTFFSSMSHPVVFKKGPFLKKIKKYITNNSGEDCIVELMPFILSNHVYVRKPCYIQVMILDDNSYRTSATIDVISQCDNDIDKINKYRIAEMKYKATGNCMSYIKPTYYDK